MQTAYMPSQATWRPRINPSNISSANASMPPYPPQGYQGPWPPPQPPGYPGPPPAQLPSSVSAHQWSKGYWRFDPKASGWSSASGAPPQPPQPPPQQQQQYYNPGVVNNNPSRPPSQQAGGPPGWHQAWMPHPGWQMPADHNPYKKVPKEPDPSYFAVELSENPLGLENMHITYVFDDFSHNFLLLITVDHHRPNLVFLLVFSGGNQGPKRSPLLHHGGGFQRTCLLVMRKNRSGLRLRMAIGLPPPVMVQAQRNTTIFPLLHNRPRTTHPKIQNRTRPRVLRK
jgi:hypothetical protein